MKKALASAAAGFCAGTVTGLLGAGGGLVLIPLLTLLVKPKESALFPTSLFIMLPICLTAIVFIAVQDKLPWLESVPYLISGGIGGWLAGRFGSRIPVKWLHRGLGIMILWGGLRYLC